MSVVNDDGKVAAGEEELKDDVRTWRTQSKGGSDGARGGEGSKGRRQRTDVAGSSSHQDALVVPKYRWSATWGLCAREATGRGQQRRRTFFELDGVGIMTGVEAC